MLNDPIVHTQAACDDAPAVLEISQVMLNQSQITMEYGGDDGGRGFDAGEQCGIAGDREPQGATVAQVLPAYISPIDFSTEHGGGRRCRR